VVSRSVPVFRDLNRAVNLPGKSNDLADAFGKLPAVDSAAARAAPPTVKALNDSLPTLSFIRPYTPDLMATISNLGKITAYYDADGHYARVEPAGLGIFHYDGPPTNNLTPIPPSQIVDDYGPFGASPNFKVFRRCPGGSTQSALDNSNPFVNPPWAGSGLSTTSDCDASDLPPGP
jgi:phospholipid/cholesterol/gamma-HCH transport system substrate-binding protein